MNTPSSFAAAALRVEVGDGPSGGRHVGRHVDVLPDRGPGRAVGARVDAVVPVASEPFIEAGLAVAGCGAGREPPGVRIAGVVEVVGTPEVGHLDLAVGDRDLGPVPHEAADSASLRLGW